MTDNSDTNMTQPNRPFAHGIGRYDALNAAAKAVAASHSTRKELFTMNITAIKKEGGCMNDETRFLIELLFNPNENGLKLRPAEIQLLLAYFGEILKELEAEQKPTEEKQSTETKTENAPCK